MAANDYFNGFQQDQNQHNQPPHSTPTPLPKPDSPPPSQPTWNNPPPSSPTPVGPYANPYEHRYSTYTLGDDHQQYNNNMGGRISEGDQYADNIPLKPNPPPKDGRPEWMDADTHYAPAQDPQTAPLDPSEVSGGKKRKNRFFKKKLAWVTHLTTLAQLIVFIVEIVKNGMSFVAQSSSSYHSSNWFIYYLAQFTGSPIMTKPSFNPMIGPSPYVQINMGSLFAPCMRTTEYVSNSTHDVQLPCPSTTSSDPKNKDNQCTLSELCGFGLDLDSASGDDKPEPNQSFRFIVPIFLHAGIIHIALNFFAQLTIGADMEREIGWWRYAIVYFASGIFGFILGGNFAPGIMSSGASGCLFGVFALCLLDLLYKWKSREKPMVELIIMLIAVVISFAIGLLPGLDNFSHIGGFVMGLTLGLSILRSPDSLRERIGTKTPYMSVSGMGVDEDKKNFVKQPLGFFKGRKPLWWAWWIVRAGALVGIIVAFIVLLNNFYKDRSTCGWCKYLTCLVSVINTFLKAVYNKLTCSFYSPSTIGVISQNFRQPKTLNALCYLQQLQYLAAGPFINVTPIYLSSLRFPCLRDDRNVPARSSFCFSWNFLSHPSRFLKCFLPFPCDDFNLYLISPVIILQSQRHVGMVPGSKMGFSAHSYLAFCLERSCQGFMGGRFFKDNTLLWTVLYNN